MPDTRYSNAPEPHQPWPPRSHPQRPSASRVLPIIGVVLGLLGLAMGVAAWFRAAPLGSAYSSTQMTEAKTTVCAAYSKALHSLRIAGNRKVDPADALPVAVNTRLAAVAVGNYLINTVAVNVAAPIDLQNSIRQLAQAYQDIALAQLADSSTADYEATAVAADKLILEIDGQCR